MYLLKYRCIFNSFGATFCGLRPFLCVFDLLLVLSGKKVAFISSTSYMIIVVEGSENCLKINAIPDQWDDESLVLFFIIIFIKCYFHLFIYLFFEW